MEDKFLVSDVRNDYISPVDLVSIVQLPEDKAKRAADLWKKVEEDFKASCEAQPLPKEPQDFRKWYSDYKARVKTNSEKDLAEFDKLVGREEIYYGPKGKYKTGTIFDSLPEDLISYKEATKD